MKKVLRLFLMICLTTALLCGCAPAGTIQSDPSEESTSAPTQVMVAETEPEFVPGLVSFKESDVNHTIGQSDSGGVYSYIVRSYDELKRLYGGSVPKTKTAHNEAFFEDHSLIVLNIGFTTGPYGIKAIELKEEKPGVYRLRFDRYTTELQYQACSYNQLVVEVDKVLEEDAELKLTSIKHVISSQDFQEMFG